MQHARMNPELYPPEHITPPPSDWQIQQAEKRWEQDCVEKYLEERDIPDTPENRAEYLKAAIDAETSLYG